MAMTSDDETGTDIEQVQGVLAKFSREEAERNAAEEQASFIARECPEDPPAADNDLKAVLPDPSDPMAYWL